jgi:hypothetical protein
MLTYAASHSVAAQARTASLKGVYFLSFSYLLWHARRRCIACGLIYSFPFSVFCSLV